MKHTSLFFSLASILALSAFASITTGCGQSSDGGRTLPPPVQGGGTVAPWDDSKPWDYNFTFKTTGQGQATQLDSGLPLQVSANGTMILAINAGGGLPLQGTGFSVGFNCEWFYVRVGNVTRQAFVKKEYYTTPITFDVCGAAPLVWHSDFSSAIGSSDATVNIRIYGAQYDNCAGYNGPGFVGIDNGGCPQHPVAPTHSVDGRLRVYTRPL